MTITTKAEAEKAFELLGELSRKMFRDMTGGSGFSEELQDRVDELGDALESWSLLEAAD